MTAPRLFSLVDVFVERTNRFREEPSSTQLTTRVRSRSDHTRMTSAFWWFS